VISNAGHISRMKQVHVSALEVVEILKAAGGYGVAGLMYYLWTQERNERFRYRDQFEAVLKDLPRLTSSLEDLTNEVSKITARHTDH
jgi:hypothetical protein